MDNLEKTKILFNARNTSFQAAIVEDELAVLTHIKNTLSATFLVNKTQVAFDCFTSGMAFLDMLQNHYHYDILFLDIEMPEINGIELCKKAREIMPDILVVFISGKEELVFQTFEVQPFRFIRKSHYNQQLSSLVQDCIGQLKARSRQIIQLIEPHSGDIFSFNVNTILYVEACGRECTIVTDKEKTEINCKFMDIEKILEDYHFLKPHRSYLVNCDFIFHIGKKNLVLSNGTEIPISRNKVIEVKQQFIKYSSF